MYNIHANQVRSAVRRASHASARRRSARSDAARRAAGATGARPAGTCDFAGLAAAARGSGRIAPRNAGRRGAEGYELVGGRLLPGSDGARAQFMFQDKAGERITLYLGAMKATAVSPALISARPREPSALSPAADVRESAFSFFDDGPVPGSYWVEQGFGYAMSGKLTREQLMRLAQTVYRQL